MQVRACLLCTGPFNLFTEALAVNFWSLDLSKPEERRILQVPAHVTSSKIEKESSLLQQESH